jgi:hypothetical protein
MRVKSELQYTREDGLIRRKYIRVLLKGSICEMYLNVLNFVLDFLVVQETNITFIYNL